MAEHVVLVVVAAVDSRRAYLKHEMSEAFSKQKIFLDHKGRSALEVLVDRSLDT